MLCTRTLCVLCAGSAACCVHAVCGGVCTSGCTQVCGWWGAARTCSRSARRRPEARFPARRSVTRQYFARRRIDTRTTEYPPRFQDRYSSTRCPQALRRLRRRANHSDRSGPAESLSRCQRNRHRRSPSGSQARRGHALSYDLPGERFSKTLTLEQPAPSALATSLS